MGSHLGSGSLTPVVIPLGAGTSEASRLQLTAAPAPARLQCRVGAQPHSPRRLWPALHPRAGPCCTQHRLQRQQQLLLPAARPGEHAWLRTCLDIILLYIHRIQPSEVLHPARPHDRTRSTTARALFEAARWRAKQILAGLNCWRGAPGRSLQGGSVSTSLEGLGFCQLDPAGGTFGVYAMIQVRAGMPEPASGLCARLQRGGASYLHVQAQN